ncbi:isoprenyl transferase [Amylibacter marinus]|uniref:Isoprenyl transferase n=1 Tax=Amylibacter marinus TaxID=1475483 RepID=A0ABQ5VSL7_9RHOB|nr:polyprenyl diphosphate synthase [Amylibacter marinus]GLQ34218.1 isoprenyl transferase [Amylibacter marinus]
MTKDAPRSPQEDRPEQLHVAIIMDGNGRWATRKSMDRLKGHARGAERVRDIVEVSAGMGITQLTLFAFSTENWKRSEREVSGLMTLFHRFIRSEKAKLIENGIRVRFIGCRERLDDQLVTLMAGLEQQTSMNTALELNVALNYGGRDEITRAMQGIAAEVSAGRLAAADICEETVAQHLDTADISDPDLVIRTSGEYRTSNFLPWQSVYAEYAFVEATWPDFTPELLHETIESFKGRNRRFGAVMNT